MCILVDSVVGININNDEIDKDVNNSNEDNISDEELADWWYWEQANNVDKSL